MKEHIMQACNEMSLSSKAIHGRTNKILQLSSAETQLTLSSHNLYYADPNYASVDLIRLFLFQIIGIKNLAFTCENPSLINSIFNNSFATYISIYRLKSNVLTDGAFSPSVENHSPESCIKSDMCECNSIKKYVTRKIISTLCSIWIVGL